MYNDDNELIGIDKTICSKIRLEMANSDIEDITFFVNPDGDIFPEKDLPEESRKLKGFVWYGDQRLFSKEDIFDEDDNNIQLVKIRGIDSPIAIDEEEQERSNGKYPKTEIQKSNNQGIKPKKPELRKVGG